MGKEVEVKVLNIKKDLIEEQLKRIGAKLVKNEYQINTIFDTIDRRIKEEHQGYLRIREKQDRIHGKTTYILTLKKNISNDGVRENMEIETKVDNAEALEQILMYLDLEVKHQGTKERISYAYEDILFEIDTWDKATYPEPYLEIEVKDKKALKRAIELLKLNPEDVTDRSLGQLRMEQGLGDL